MLVRGCQIPREDVDSRQIRGGSAHGSLAITITQKGHSPQFMLPKTAKGGLVQVTLQNQTKMPDSVQLVQVQGGQSIQAAYKIIAGQFGKTPPWMRAIGGVASTPPGQTGTASLQLPAGKYLVTELPGPQASGPPAKAELTVTPGNAGSLPTASATVTAQLRPRKSTSGRSPACTPVRTSSRSRARGPRPST